MLPVFCDLDHVKYGRSVVTTAIFDKKKKKERRCTDYCKDCTTTARKDQGHARYWYARVGRACRSKNVVDVLCLRFYHPFSDLGRSAAAVFV